jgi:hypothetical protein
MSCPRSLKSEAVDRIHACQRMARAVGWPIASMRPSRRSARRGRRSDRTPGQKIEPARDEVGRVPF